MKYIIEFLELSMSFRVIVSHPKIEQAILKFAEDNLRAPKMVKERGRIYFEPGDEYYIYMQTIPAFVFHKFYYDKIKRIINNTALDYKIKIEINECKYEPYEPYKCKFNKFGTALYEKDPESRFFFQNDVIDESLASTSNQVIFSIGTGRGKTLMSQKLAVLRGERICLIHRPTYVDKWLFDLCEDPKGLNLKREEVYVAHGVQGIYDLVRYGLDGVLNTSKIKAIILPTTSLSLFMNEYIESAISAFFDIVDFYKILDVGTVIYDEIHEHFYTVYRSGILLNPPKTIEMSGTLVPSNFKEFIKDRYLERFPMSSRITVKHIPVVDCRALYYEIRNKKVVNKSDYMKPYNHKLFEQMLSNRDMDIPYFDMVYDILDRAFITNYQEGQKALVFFATVEMCINFVKYLKKKLDNKFDICKYNSGDDYDAFIAADIGVSTPGKAGTAIDIPGLVTVIVTTAIDDQQLNQQITGRPRFVTKWNLTPKVWFLHCSNINKHLRYLQSRIDALKPLVKSFVVSHSPYIIRRSDVNTTTTTSSYNSLLKPNSRKLFKLGSKRVSRGKRGRK